MRSGGPSISRNQRSRNAESAESAESAENVADAEDTEHADDAENADDAEIFAFSAFRIIEARRRRSLGKTLHLRLRIGDPAAQATEQLPDSLCGGGSEEKV